ncbi:MAG: tripartite tricarboxylate transporter TctB family protein [Desulfobacteraceae bacterium]|nr:MAG: tripartite tricarboxylate transporter TctB family protein [Desulfobacteraceae bacterium]
MKKDLAIGLVAIAVSTACVIDLVNMKQGFIMEDQVSASFFPYMMVGLLGVLGVLQAIGSSAEILRARKEERKPEKIDWGKLKRRYQVPSLMFIFVSVYIFLIPVIGFYTMTVFFFIALGMLLGGLSIRNILKVAGATAGTILFMYFIFEVSLQVYMPTGIFY